MPIFNQLNFTPLRGFASKHLQTAIPLYLSPGLAPPSSSLLIELGERDRLSCEVSIPDNWQAHHRTIALVHGLGGSHNSVYMVRLARKLFLKGNKVVRINLRGAGSGIGLSKVPYYGGSSPDLLKALRVLKEEAPNSDIYVVGFSLGGNIALKLAGELQAEASQLIATLIAVCAPLDLADTGRLLAQKRNALYHFSYLRSIIKQTKVHIQHEINTLYEYDDKVTARLWGYQGAADYYQKCSSIHFLPKICCKTHLLFAGDDPFINIDLLNGKSPSKHVKLWKTEQGGHMGFLGPTRKRDSYFWMDQLLLNWLEDDFTSDMSHAIKLELSRQKYSPIP